MWQLQPDSLINTLMYRRHSPTDTWIQNFELMTALFSWNITVTMATVYLQVFSAVVEACIAVYTATQTNMTARLTTRKWPRNRLGKTTRLS